MDIKRGSYMLITSRGLRAIFYLWKIWMALTSRTVIEKCQGFCMQKKKKLTNTEEEDWPGVAGEDTWSNSKNAVSLWT